MQSCPKHEHRLRRPRRWHPNQLKLRVTLAVLLLVLLTSPPLGRCEYVEKDDKNAHAATEPVLKPGTQSVFAPGPGEYPYYGNAPADMLPYRNIEPFYRYWLTRLPFRGPGKDYPDPTNVTSLRVGLLNPPPYGLESKRGEMSRKGRPAGV